ncbi:MAG: radical SAM family heme chaperone HemW [Acidobacteria bacterium]|nr:radical SAM family heme chaperone HemW [Acidobacteriota bacterium]
MLGLYVHVPFCQAICSYCNFNRGLYDAELKARYVPALEREIREAGDGRQADTIFFGGGTPSLLEPAEVGRILRACEQAFRVTPDAEVTLETNPETVTPERLAAFRDQGVNRLSFGAQSFDNTQLARLGRIHDADRIDAAIAAARGAGFDNLSLDLMFWLPGQSRSSWLHSLDRAIGLAPDHLSLYLLELYPNAPLKEAMARQQAPTVPSASTAASDWVQASDDEAADMYLEGLERLSAAGYEQYEISNVARPGFQSRHNLKYWTAGEWRGFGCGAHSTLDQRRWQNVPGTLDYIERIEQGRDVAILAHALDERARIEEALFTGLRLTAGIDDRDFAAKYGLDPWAVYGERLSDAFAAGLVWRRADRFGLTRPGMLLANEILSVFV